MTTRNYYFRTHCSSPVDGDDDQEAIEGSNHPAEPSVERTYIGNAYTPTFVRREPNAKALSPMRIPIIDNIFGRQRELTLYPVEHGPSPPRRRQLGFLDLPGELRNRIYELLTHSPKVFIDAIGRFAPHHDEIGWCGGVRGNRFHESGTMVSLRRTCKQVYQEATSLVFGSTFVFRDYYELCGFVAQLAQAPPEMRVKTFERVVLHIGRDRQKLPHTIILNKDDSRLPECSGGGGKFKYERSSVIACGWWKGIVMLLHHHNVKNLELVAGFQYRQLLTKRDVKKPLIMNLLKTNFHVGSLKIRDFDPEIDLSKYALPKQLIARWEGSTRQAEALTRGGITTSAENEAVTDKTKVLRNNLPLTDDIKVLRKKRADTSSVGAELWQADWTQSFLETEEHGKTLSFTEKKQELDDQTAELLGEELNLSKPFIHVPDDLDWKSKIWASWPMTKDERRIPVVLNEEEGLTGLGNSSTPRSPFPLADPDSASPRARRSTKPCLSARLHTASINEQMAGQKRSFSEYKKDVDPGDVATQDFLQWYEVIKALWSLATDVLVSQEPIHK